MRTHLKGPSTERLELRAKTTADAAAFFALNSDPEVMRFTGEPPLESLEQAEQAITDYPDFKTIGYGRWGCFTKEGGEMIGFCGLKYLPELDQVDLGYRFLPQYWGRGIATEACAACLRFGFDILELDHIVALVLPENKASIRVLEKIGMKPEGEIRYGELTPLQFGIHKAR